MSETIPKVPDPDRAEIARRAAEIRAERLDDSRDDTPRGPVLHGREPSRLMLRAMGGFIITRWRHHEPKGRP